MTYIDPRGKVLGHLDRLVGWSNGYKPAPVTVEWDLSNRCVLGCQNCHFSYTHTRGPWASRARQLPMAHDKAGDIADTGLVLSVIGQLEQAGVKSIVWSGGGEPTTHPEWMRIVEEAYACGLEQGMYTLGGLLTPESGRHLANLATWVVVSLDAKDGDTYASEKGVPQSRFNEALNGIDALVGRKAIVGVSFLLHSKNWMQAWDMLRLARKHGATYTTFRPTIKTQPNAPSECSDNRFWIDDARHVLAEVSQEPDVEIDLARFAQYRDWAGHGYHQCLGIRLNATITPDGRVWICSNRREFQDSCLGDLREDSFASIWARHPGHFQVDSNCRVMCRLNPVNEQLSAIYMPRQHGAFV